VRLGDVEKLVALADRCLSLGPHLVREKQKQKDKKKIKRTQNSCKLHDRNVKL
jgi:hypothetical protein